MKQAIATSAPAAPERVNWKNAGYYIKENLSQPKLHRAGIRGCIALVMKHHFQKGYRAFRGKNPTSPIHPALLRHMFHPDISAGVETDMTLNLITSPGSHDEQVRSTQAAVSRFSSASPYFVVRTKEEK